MIEFRRNGRCPEPPWMTFSGRFQIPTISQSCRNGVACRLSSVYAERLPSRARWAANSAPSKFTSEDRGYDVLIRPPDKRLSDEAPWEGGKPEASRGPRAPPP